MILNGCLPGFVTTNPGIENNQKLTDAGNQDDPFGVALVACIHRGPELPSAPPAQGCGYKPNPFDRLQQFLFARPIDLLLPEVLNLGLQVFMSR